MVSLVEITKEKKKKINLVHLIRLSKSILSIIFKTELLSHPVFSTDSSAHARIKIRGQIPGGTREGARLPSCCSALARPSMLLACDISTVLFSHTVRGLPESTSLDVRGTLALPDRE